MLEAFNFRVILEYLPLYGQCFLATLWLSGLSLFGAIVVGIIACAMRLSQSRIMRSIAGVYIESIRSTPLLAQLYFFYFGLPSLGDWLLAIGYWLLAFGYLHGVSDEIFISLVSPSSFSEQTPKPGKRRI